MALTAVEEILVKKGKDLVWQNPRRDKHCIVQMARLSPRNGYLKYGKIHWDIVETPTEKGYYHFYQLGDNYPGDFSLIARKNQWYKLSEWCKVYDLVIRIYDKHGRLFPLNDAYTFRTYNDNIIIAVLRNDFISDINDEPLYINFYRNYFYTTADKNPQEEHIEYLGYTKTKTSKVSTFLNNRRLSQRRKAGKFRLTENGYLVETMKTDAKAELGEVGELHYDMSIREVVDIPMNTLRTFKSTLDGKNKYLVHPPKNNVNLIDYRDDIDIFVCYKDPKTKAVKGLYYHRNQEDAVRMVTHRDWSLPVPYVMSYVETLSPTKPNLRNFFLRIYIRDNGPENEIIESVNMTKALYRLSDEKIIQAMTAVDSVMPEWRADYLEQSAYTALMRSYHDEITPALVLDAFGYSTTVRQLAYPNIRLTKHVNGNHFEIPVGIRDVCTVFEYDQYGLLLGWYHHSESPKYYPRNRDCVFIEAYSGEGTSDITIHIGNQPFDLKYDTAYRFYLARTELRSDIANVVSEWKDATADSRILVDGTRCTFGHDNLNEIGVAIGDDNFLCYDFEVDGTDGLFDFAITYGKSHLTKLPVPPGKIDIWMNGRALVEDIDYFIDYPMVTVVAKRYVTDDLAKQKITVRCMGFPFTSKGYLKRIKPREVGFVQYGKVSVDAHYDLHEDKVLRTVVDGGVFDPAVIPFDEQGSAIVERFSKDGVPYSVETPYIAIGGVMGVSLYQARNKDYEITTRAGEYITEHAEKTERPLPPVIDDKYEVYSPFLSKITMDLLYGRFKSPLPNISLMDLDKIVEQYKRYLPVDPVIRGYDKNFVNVHAHNFKSLIDLTARDVAFLERLSQVYLRGEVDVSKFFRVRN